MDFLSFLLRLSPENNLFLYIFVSSISKSLLEKPLSAIEVCKPLSLKSCSPFISKFGFWLLLSNFSFGNGMCLTLSAALTAIFAASIASDVGLLGFDSNVFCLICGQESYFQQFKSASLLDNPLFDSTIYLCQLKHFSDF